VQGANTLPLQTRISRVLTEQETLTAYDRTLSYRYDLAGNRTRVTYPDNHYVEYSYDVLNRISGSRIAGDWTEFISSATDFRALGREGELAAEARLNEMGYTIVGSQVWVRTAETNELRIVDFLVTGGPIGNTLGAYEAKVNLSERTARQARLDEMLMRSGGHVVNWGQPNLPRGTYVRFGTAIMRCYNCGTR
jgi:YD repeat-containing protein